MDAVSTGPDLRRAREVAELSQEHVAYALGWTVGRYRRTERAPAVSPEVARRHADAVRMLVGLRRSVARRIVRAARAAAV